MEHPQKRLKTEEPRVEFTLGSYLRASRHTKTYLSAAIVGACARLLVKDRPRVLYIHWDIIDVALRKDRAGYIANYIEKTMPAWKTLCALLYNEKHWSCLILEKVGEACCGYHYDSLPRYNKKICRRVLGIMDSTGVLGTSYEVRDAAFYIQDNYFECGHYVLLAIHFYMNILGATYKTRKEYDLAYEKLFSVYKTKSEETMHMNLDAIYTYLAHFIYDNTSDSFIEKIADIK